MKTFNQELKDVLVAEIIKHREADQILQGTYEKEVNGIWKYCAVGCAIHSLNTKLGKNYKTNDHTVYETEFGIPVVLANLQDKIFEGLTTEDSKTWPENFMNAVPVNTDLSLVWPKFAVWLLADETDGVRKFITDPEVLKAFDRVVKLYQKQVAGEIVTKADWEAAAYATYAASVSVYAVAYAAVAADAADAAASAAYAAAYAAYAAAYVAVAAVAADAAYSTSEATSSAASAAYSADAARHIHYAKCAAKLIEILKSTK